jgi:hypothetical protein
MVERGDFFRPTQMEVLEYLQQGDLFSKFQNVSGKKKKNKIAGVHKIYLYNP